MLKGLLQFIFRSSNLEPAVKLNDALKIVSIYEKLKGNAMFGSIECHYLYAIAILQQLSDGHEVLAVSCKSDCYTSHDFR